MNRLDFLRLYAYSDNCWRLMGEVLTSAQGAWDTCFDTVSKWNTIRLLLAHCVAAEERLISFRLLKKEIPLSFEERAPETWDELYADQKSIRAGTYAYIASLSDSEVSEDNMAIFTLNGHNAVTRADVLYHIVNHENYHRGQIVSELQRRGFDPPNFDYILLKDIVQG
jgi:uncharacterized damage-inducible protein DinB